MIWNKVLYLPVTSAFILTLLPLLHFGDALDSHLVSGWCVLSFVLFVGISSGFLLLSKNAIWISIGVVTIALVQSMNGRLLNLEDAFLLLTTVLVFGVKPKFLSDGFIRSVRLGVIAGLLLIILFLLCLLLKAIFIKGYSHEATYSVQPFFAHRNIVVESCMLCFYWLLRGCVNRKSAWLWVIGAGALAFIFQSRSAMVMWAIMVALEHRRLFVKGHIANRLGLMGLIVFCLLQLVVSALPVHIYKPFFDRLPDNIKSLDISYNLSEARSSSDRIELWKWTSENLNLWGHGLGQWRADAQGEVNERIGRCDLFVRHAHSDFLEYLYELGIIPCVFFATVLLYLGWRNVRFILVFLPLLLFSFPTERPEIMLFLGFSMLVPNTVIGNESSKITSKPIGVVLSGLMLFGISTWGYSQHLFGRFFLKTVDIAELNTFQQIVVATYPQDLLNNSLALYQAHYLIAHGDIDGAVQILEDRLRVSPNDLGVYKQLMQLKPTAAGRVLNCAENN